MRQRQAKRPVCVNCGKPYGRRDAHSETVRWSVGESRPPYRGNGILLKEGHEYKTSDRATVRGVTALSVNPKVRSQQEALIANAPERSEMVATRWIWDGVTWVGGYEPFCTLRCALDYARRAYAAERTRIE